MRLYRRLGYAPVGSRPAMEVTRAWAVGPYGFEPCTLVELRKALPPPARPGPAGGAAGVEGG